MGSVMDQERPWERKEREEYSRKRRDQIANLGGVETLKKDMLERLAKAFDKQKHRPLWHEEGCTDEDLSRGLREAVERGDPVTVANFCMMLHARGEFIV